MKNRKTYSHFFTPFAQIDKKIDFHYLTSDERGYVFGIVIDKKRQHQLYISKKGQSIKVFKEF